MPLRRIVLVTVLLVVASSVAVGATTPTPSPTATPASDEPVPVGVQLSGFMQASAAQATGAVGNGLWTAAYATSDDEAERRALVEGRVGELNASLAELQAERRELRAQYRAGEIDEVTYRARLSALVGQLAALGDGIEDAEVRGRAVGVDADGLATLRAQARELGGGEVSQLARDLAGGHDPPGQAGVFGDDHPGRAGEGGPPDSTGPGNGGQGPPTDQGSETAGNTTATPTASPTDSSG